MPRHYTSQRRALQSIAAFRAEYRQQKKHAKEATDLDNEVHYVGHALKELYGPNALIDYETIRAAVAARLPDHQLVNGSRTTVAVHECGHFVAFELEGLSAGQATIRGSAFGKGGWGGVAFHCGNVYLRSWPWLPDPEDLSRFSRATLAGPIAEELLADGCALHNPGELLNASVYSGRAAEFYGARPSEVWEQNVMSAVALVECWSAPILKLAVILEKRKEITRASPSVRTVLRTIIPCQIVGHRLSDEGRAVAERIIQSTPETTAFIIKRSDT